MTLEEQIKDAKDGLAKIRDKFKDDPDLLSCYEPSAIYLVEALEGARREEQK